MLMRYSAMIPEHDVKENGEKHESFNFKYRSLNIFSIGKTVSGEVPT